LPLNSATLFTKVVLAESTASANSARLANWKFQAAAHRLQHCSVALSRSVPVMD
jgi:hypothetical protein